MTPVDPARRQGSIDKWVGWSRALFLIDVSCTVEGGGSMYLQYKTATARKVALRGHVGQKKGSRISRIDCILFALWMMM